MPRRYKRKPSKRLAQRVKQVEQLLKKTTENKVIDKTLTAPGGTNISTTPWGFVNPFIFPQVSPESPTGPSNDQRIGDSVCLMSQTFRGQVILPTVGSGQDNNNQVRVLIVENLGYDFATDLQLTDVLQFGDYITNGDLVFSSPYKTRGETTKLYRVHYDKVHQLGYGQKYYSNIKKRIAYGKTGKVLKYQTDSSRIPNNHCMVVFAISDSGVSLHPILHMTVRNIYKD